MRLRIVLPIATLCVLVAAAPAWAEGPRLTPTQKKEISAVVDRFIHDVVLRENLPDGWRIAGPQMRGGITKKDWYAGHELPVQRLKLIGDDWSDAWNATYPFEGPITDEVGLSVSLRIGRGEDAEVWDEEMVLIRRNGRWLVNGIYTNAIFRIGGKKTGSCVTSDCMTTGLNDFLGGGLGGNAERGDAGPAIRLSINWFSYLIAGLIGLPLTVLLGGVLYSRYRNRRAWVEYLASKSPEERLALSRE